ncbi:hypothetical protein L1887_18547 [Cichorium endivia]|nr:hypothetical protein L1887_18547 [Cichorium endivia]
MFLINISLARSTTVSSSQAVKQSSSQAVKQSSSQAVKQSNSQTIKQSSSQAVKQSSILGAREAAVDRKQRESTPGGVESGSQLEENDKGSSLKMGKRRVLWEAVLT